MSCNLFFKCDLFELAGAGFTVERHMALMYVV